MKKEIEDEGYYLGLKFEQAELWQLRWLISFHFGELYRTQLGIEHYHERPAENHSTLWPKHARILCRGCAQQIMEMSVMKKLEEGLGPFEVTDEEKVGHPEFIWRLVRPDHPEDVGPLHADEWFWTILGRTSGPRLRLWTAIYCGPEQGFRYVPQSHKRDWPHTERNGKPHLDVPESELDIRRFECEPGDSILFHDKLIHGGLVGGDRTRVSLEFTIVYA